VLRRSVEHYGYFDTPVAVSFAMIREEQHRAEAPTLFDALKPDFLGRVDIALLQGDEAALAAQVLIPADIIVQLY
jgi:hypothetical protein